MYVVSTTKSHVMQLGFSVYGVFQVNLNAKIRVFGNPIQHNCFEIDSTIQDNNYNINVNLF